MILDAAQDCFLRDGFHATSMQDLLRATGLSAGAFYRYFPSKEALVAAIAASAFSELASMFGSPAANEPSTLHELLCSVIHGVEEMDTRHATLRLAVQFWGEAQRNAALAETVRGAIGSILKWFEDMVSAMQARGELPGAVAASKLASTLLGLVQGFMVQRVLVGVRAQDYCEGLPLLNAPPTPGPVSKPSR